VLVYTQGHLQIEERDNARLFSGAQSDDPLHAAGGASLSMYVEEEKCTSLEAEVEHDSPKSETQAADERKKAISLAVVGYAVLLGDTARGIMFPILAPMIAALEQPAVVLGAAVGLFSAGR
jgi:hypothetical protein